MNNRGKTSRTQRHGAGRNPAKPRGALRHCMVVHAYYPLGETRVAREAMALLDRGHSVDVICLRGENEPVRDVVDGVGVYRLPLRRYKGWGRLVQLLEYLTFFALVLVKLSALHWRKRYHVVQVHNLPDFLIFAAVVPKSMGAKLILDLHDLMPEFFAALTGGTMGSRGVRLLLWQERLSCWFADRVITVTDVWKETLIARGVRADKVHVVMNVADPRIFRRPAQPRRRAKRATPAPRPQLEPALPRVGTLPVPSSTEAPNPASDGAPEPFRLIYHGTFTHRYGVDLIIRAVARVGERIPHIRLSLLGDGESRADLLALTEQLGLDGVVHFSTRVLPAEELPERIAQSHVGIVPNRSNIFTDGLLPTKLMEYVALGVPVIAARTPTIATYFDETMLRFFTPGHVDELAECIVELYENRDVHRQLVESADRFNQRYNWASVAAEYVELVEQLSG